MKVLSDGRVAVFKARKLTLIKSAAAGGQWRVTVTILKRIKPTSIRKPYKARSRDRLGCISNKS